MNKSVPRVTVRHHSAEPRDAKTVTLGTDLSVRTSHSCQILILYTYIKLSTKNSILTISSRYGKIDTV